MSSETRLSQRKRATLRAVVIRVNKSQYVYANTFSILRLRSWLHIARSLITLITRLTTQQPSYLANIIRLRAASRQLRFWWRNLLHDDRTNLAFTDRAYSHAAPAVWNSLPLDIVSDLSCLAIFKRLVKTELYNRAYLRWLVTTRTHDSSLCEWLNVRHQPRNNNGSYNHCHGMAILQVEAVNKFSK